MVTIVHGAGDGIKRNTEGSVDLALLLLRGALGSLMAGHGAQKLFGWFEGPGLQGTSGWVESMGLRPGRYWGLAAGASEFGGGVLTLLGFLSPLGPVGIVGSLSMATAKVHWGKPIWVTSGGAELPVSYGAIAAALLVAGSGKYSLDRLLGTRLPTWVTFAGLAGVAAAVAIGMQSSASAPQQAPKEEAAAELQAGQEAAHSI